MQAISLPTAPLPRSGADGVAYLGCTSLTQGVCQFGVSWEEPVQDGAVGPAGRASLIHAYIISVVVGADCTLDGARRPAACAARGAFFNTTVTRAGGGVQQIGDEQLVLAGPEPRGGHGWLLLICRVNAGVSASTPWRSVLSLDKPALVTGLTAVPALGPLSLTLSFSRPKDLGLGFNVSLPPWATVFFRANISRCNTLECNKLSCSRLVCLLLDGTLCDCGSCLARASALYAAPPPPGSPAPIPPFTYSVTVSNANAQSALAAGGRGLLALPAPCAFAAGVYYEVRIATENDAENRVTRPKPSPSTYDQLLTPASLACAIALSDPPTNVRAEVFGFLGVRVSWDMPNNTGAGPGRTDCYGATPHDVRFVVEVSHFATFMPLLPLGDAENPYFSVRPPSTRQLVFSGLAKAKD